MALRIPPNDVMKFHDWLRVETPDDHLLLQLWIALDNVSQLRAGMTDKDTVLTLKWVPELLRSLSPETRQKLTLVIEPLTREAERTARGDDDVGGTWPRKMRQDVRAKIEPVLSPLFKRYRGEGEAEPKPSAGSGANLARIAALRRDTATVLRRARAGRFWVVAKALDGKPFALLTDDVRRHPSATSAEAAAGEHADPAVGTWQTDGRRVFLQVTGPPGDVVRSMKAALDADVVLGQPQDKEAVAWTRVMRAIEAENRAEARKLGGQVWFAPIGREDAPVLVLHTGQMKRRAEDLVRPDPLARDRVVKGTWAREAATRSVKVKLAATAPASVKRELRTLLLALRVFAEPTVVVE